MSTYKAITKTDFADLRWKRFDSYAFAAQDAVAPLVARRKRGQTLRYPHKFGLLWSHGKPCIMVIRNPSLKRPYGLDQLSDGRPTVLQRQLSWSRCPKNQVRKLRF
jgi:hypothetical protein